MLTYNNIKPDRESNNRIITKCVCALQHDIVSMKWGILSPLTYQLRQDHNSISKCKQNKNYLRTLINKYSTSLSRILLGTPLEINEKSTNLTGGFFILSKNLIKVLPLNITDDLHIR